MTPPKGLLKTQPAAALSTEERLAELERRARRSRRDHRELRAMLGVTCSKVDTLCDTLKPVVEWATVQIAEEKKDAASWRETWRGARHKFLIYVLGLAFALASSALGVEWLTAGGP